MLKVLVYIAVVCLTVVSGDNVIGSPCTIAKDGSNGTCQYLQDCMPVRKNLDFESLPEMCSYDKTQLIVCCNQVSCSHESESPDEHESESPDEHESESPDEHESESPQAHMCECPEKHVSESPEKHAPKSPKEYVSKSLQKHVSDRPETRVFGSKKAHADDIKAKSIQKNKEGSPCTIEKDGSSGTCQYLQNCNSVMEDLDSECLPQICSYDGSQIIICCKSVPNSVMTANQEPPKVDKVETKVGQKSEEKCKEYAQYVYEVRAPQTLVRNSNTTKELVCTFEKHESKCEGNGAKVGEFPHMALIGYDTKKDGKIKLECEGSLISEYYVLTAAHCVSHPTYGEAKLVLLGVTNRTDIAYRQIIKIVGSFKHPKFSSQYHDIALLKLAEEVNFSPYVRPACLHTLSQISTKRAVASSWGFTRDRSNCKDGGGVLSRELSKIYFDIYDDTQCNNTYRNLNTTVNSSMPDGTLNEYIVCAGSKSDKGKDVCQGDFGGPLQIYHDTQDIQCMYDIVGVTGFGIRCTLTADTPGIYTRVARYIDWIENIVWP